MKALEMTIGEALRLARRRLLERFERKKPEPEPVRPAMYYEPPLSQAMRAQIEAQRNAYGQRSLTQLAMMQQQAALLAQQAQGLGQRPVSYGGPWDQMSQVHTSAFPFLHSAVFHPNLPPRWYR